MDGMPALQPSEGKKLAITYPRLELRAEVYKGDTNLGVIHIQVKAKVVGSDKC